jgi:hypothetical protein
MAFCGCLLLRSLLGAKRIWPIALHMSAYDPKRTFATAESKSRKFAEEKIDGGKLAVPGDDEIGSGVSRRLARAARHPTDPPAIANHLRRGGQSRRA